MKKSTFITACFIMGFSAFSGAFSGYVKSRAYQTLEIVPPYSANHINSENTTVGYVCKEKNNKVAIYTKMKNGVLKLYGEYNVLVNMLPKYDRELLKKGIEFDNLSDALVLIENYSG
ncbi:MAG: hypothetical protein IKA17_00180 [Clostridia bacterium]|nr:hypothetical protein [Clostridia bacterium]